MKMSKTRLGFAAALTLAASVLLGLWWPHQPPRGRAVVPVEAQDLEPLRSAPYALPASPSTVTPDRRSADPAPSSGRGLRSAVAAVARPALQLPAADLSQPYPFQPGQAHSLDPDALLEVLERYYGAALPEGWRLLGVRLPGDGRFDLQLEAGGQQLGFRGTLHGEAGLARLSVEGASLAEPQELVLPLPPGVQDLVLGQDQARVNSP